MRTYRCPEIGCGYSWVGPSFERDRVERRHRAKRHEAVVEAEMILEHAVNGWPIPAGIPERQLHCTCPIAEIYDPDCAEHGAESWRWR